MIREFLTVKGTIGFYDSVKAGDALTQQTQATSWINELSKEGIMVLYILTKVDGKVCYYRQRAGGDGIESVSEATFNAEFMAQAVSAEPKSELPPAVENVPSETDIDSTADENGAAYDGGEDSAEDSAEEDDAPDEISVAETEYGDDAQAPPLIDYERIRQILADELENFFKKKLG